MTYVGDFPPCTHKFVVSSGVVICERCGVFASGHANFPTTIKLTSAPRAPLADQVFDPRRAY